MCDAEKRGGGREVKQGDGGYIFRSEKGSRDKGNRVVQALLLKGCRWKDLSWWNGEGNDGDTFVETGGSTDVTMM